MYCRICWWYSRIAANGRLLGELFLASGSISDPEKGYHFEIVCSDAKRAEQLQTIIRSFSVDAKIVQRKKSHVVYVKEGAQIVEMLGIMEANIALMNLETCGS